MSRTGILSLALAISLSAYALASRASATALSAIQQTGNDFRWSGQIQRGRSIEIKNINGQVDAVLAPGNQVEVVARKHGRRSDPASVEIMVIEHGEGVTICAVYPTPRDARRPNECRPGGGGANVAVTTLNGRIALRKR